MSLMGHFRQIDPLPTLSACPLRSVLVSKINPITDLVVNFPGDGVIPKLNDDIALTGPALHCIEATAADNKPRSRFPFRQRS
jgi:hypothetical protein